MVTRRPVPGCEALEVRRLFADNFAHVGIEDVIEEGRTTTLQVSLTVEDGVPRTVNLEITGTAGNGVDYTTIPTSVVIDAFRLSTSLEITTIDDIFPEQPETITVRILPGDGYIIGNGEATATIVDPQARFTGFVFNDRNGSGVRDQFNEEFVGGFLLAHEYQGMTTFVPVGADGFFDETIYIDGPDNTHRFTATAPGFEPRTVEVSTDTSAQLTIPLSGSDNATIEGFAFIDNDRNGFYDPLSADEATQFLRVRIEAFDGSIIASTTANSSGRWTLTVPSDQLPGQFLVIAESDSAVLDLASPASVNVQLSKGDLRDDLSFFLVRQPATVTVRTLDDTDGDGDGDNPLNAPVQLRRVGPDGLPNTDDDILVEQKDSGSDGTVEFTIPDNQTSPVAQYFVRATGGNSTLLETVLSDVFAMEVGDQLQRDLIFTKKARISGRVRFDNNGNGKINNSDPGLEGYRVQLLQNGVVVRSDSTTSNGTYVFLDLQPGDYTVQVLPPSDAANPDAAVQTVGPNPQGVTLRPGDHPGIHFLVTQEVSMDFQALPVVGATEVAIVPGSKAKLSNTIRFQFAAGNGIASTLGVQYFLQNADDPNAPLISAAPDGKVKLKPGQQKTVSLKQLKPESPLEPGRYNLIARAVPGSTTVDSDASNDQAIHGGTLTYALAAGELAPGFKQKKTSFSYNGENYQLQLSGPGQVRLDPHDGVVDVHIISTSGVSKITVKTSGDINDVFANQPLRSFSGNFDLLGDAMFSGGLRQLTMSGDIVPDFDHTLFVGPGASRLDAKLGNVHRTTAVVDLPVLRMQAKSLHDSNVDLRTLPTFIEGMRITGGGTSFSNTRVTAQRIGPVDLKGVQFANNGTLFGFAATEMGRIKMLDETGRKLTVRMMEAGAETRGDLRIILRPTLMDDPWDDE